MHKILIAGPKLRSDRALAATHMHHKPALDLGEFEQLGSTLGQAQGRDHRHK